MDKKDHWENIYKNKSPLEVSWYQQRPDISLALIRKYASKKTAEIIDVGGGASTLCDGLLEAGYSNVTVLDLSDSALAHARQRLGSKAEFVDWEAGDVTYLKSDHQYDVWHDRAVFHFLTDKRDRDKYKQVLASSVRTNGYVIIAVFEVGGPIKCSGLDIVQYDVEKLRTELGNDFAFVEELYETHITPAGVEQLFGYYIFAKQA